MRILPLCGCTYLKFYKMKNYSPIISIIIPVYNVAPYIELCLQSVFNQTYPKIEVLIIDDCGKDNSMQLVESFLNKISDSRFRVIHHSKNLGLSAARNTGIKESSGDYLYFIDSDDFITENCIETFIEILRNYPDSEIILGSAICYPKNWTSHSIINVKNKKIPEYSHNKKWINSSFYKRNFLPVTAWNKLISKDFFLKNNLFFKEGITYEDVIWNFKTANHCYKVAFNKNDTYYFRNNPTSITHNYGIKDMDSEILIIKECIHQINYKCIFSKLSYIMHFAHTAYCRRYGSSQATYIRYPKAFIFFIKCIFMKPEKLRKYPI